MADEPLIPPAAPPPAAPPPAAPPPAAPPPSAPPAAAAPWYADTKLGVDDETRSYLVNKNFSTLEDALRSGMHANRVALNRNAIELPAADKVLEWDGFEKLGAPKDPTGYAFKLDGIEGPARAEWDRMLGALTPAMHQARMLPQQAQMVVDAVRNYGKAIEEASIKAHAAETEKLDAELRSAWGNDFDKNREIARRAVEFMGLPQDQEDVLSEIMGNPIFVKGFHRLGALMSEDQMIPAGGGAPQEGPATARMKIERLKGDAAFRAALNDPRNPAHATSKAEWDRLNTLAAKET